MPQTYDKLHTYQTCGKSEISAATVSADVFTLSEATSGTCVAKSVSRMIATVHVWLHPLARP